MYKEECIRESEYRRVYTGEVLLEPESMDSGTLLQSTVLELQSGRVGELQRCRAAEVQSSGGTEVKGILWQSCIITELLSLRVAEAYQGKVN